MQNQSGDSHKRSKKTLTVKILINITLMFAIAVALVWLSTVWLDSWTDHGNFATVPDIKGMPYDKALEKLENDGFEVVLSDSVYDNNSRPGTVIDQNPKVGAKVKNGRAIYLTVNAFSARAVTIPNLTDVSLRQAQAILRGLGIQNITVETVPSDFEDLVLAVKRNGRHLSTGARVPVTSHIVLEVGAGLPDEINPDSIAATDSIPVEHLNLL